MLYAACCGLLVIVGDGDCLFEYLLLYYQCSLLVVTNKQTPIVHHAEHLANLRKQCAKAPLGVLKAFKAYKQQGGDGDGDVPVKKGEVEAASSNCKPKSSSNSNSRSRAKPAAAEEEQFNTFDNIDAVVEDTDDNSQGVETSSSSNSWGNILNMNATGNKPTGKAAKFAV